ncbi:hypothetical protein [Brevundimonas variabilis]|uniref:Uncharacterized protein n=1 Tax=Brevundimonas variabilis TaxID=74312 RepID=A0A7W9CFJ9_9CAUL|nr:hypothetical protein [Brevundimonas variabilis]MBB5744728.1 hypothetical protein [Brevundimonas variabilis]
MKIHLLTAAAVGTLALSTAGMVTAQTAYGSAQTNTRQDTLGAVLGALFGTGGSALDTAWARGQRPLNDGRSQFSARIDADVRAGTLDRNSASRLNAEYDALVALETRYGSDRRFTPTETAELNSRYDALTASLEAGGYADDLGGYQSVVDGRADFDARVNAAVSARQLTRVEATRLRADYAALIQTEAGYQSGGLTAREREDIESRLDALDARLGVAVGAGGGYAQQDPRTRLAAIERALTSTTLARAEAADIRVEHGDLVRLEAAYSRTSPSSDDRAYLDRRIGELETRARVTVRR